MSDEAFPRRPALMSAVRARNLSRIYKRLANELRREDYAAEADQAERDALWWMSYAISLGQKGPGAEG